MDWIVELFEMNALDYLTHDLVECPHKRMMKYLENLCY